MVNLCRHDGNGPWLILLDISVINADTLSGNHLMGFQLCFMDVDSDLFIRCDPDQVIAECSVRIFGCNDVFELHTLEHRMG